MGWSKLAIWGNVPDQDKARFGSVDNITSQDFMNLWRAKVMGGNGATPPDPGAIGAAAGQSAGAFGLTPSAPIDAASQGAQAGAGAVAPHPAPIIPAGGPPGSSNAPLSLAGLLGVDTGNIGGTGVSLSGNGLTIPGVGTIGGGVGSNLQQQQQASLAGPDPIPLSPMPKKQIDMRGIAALAQQPQLGLLTGAF